MAFWAVIQLTHSQRPHLSIAWAHMLQVVNRDELMSALQDIGHTLGMAVRPYTATARAPFESYLSVMARTGVLVSRHGPLLANSIFLPPGGTSV